MSGEVIVIKFNVYGKHFEKSVPRSLLETKTKHQIVQQAYKEERYKIIRDTGIGTNNYKPKRKNKHYNNNEERLESTRKRSREYQRKKRLKRNEVQSKKT